MKARLYQPAKNAMQSGTAKTHEWVLEFVRKGDREIDPLMGWTSSSDMQSQVKLKFASKEAALDYVKQHKIDASIVETSTKRKANLRATGYAENFAPNRRGAWTH